MTTIEKIRAEIERIMERAMNDVGRDVCQYILAFLDTLEAEEKEMDKAGRALVDAVERHCAPRPGQEYCLRSELLNTKETFKKLLK